jgi:hypothetical protein
LRSISARIVSNIAINFPGAKLFEVAQALRRLLDPSRLLADWFKARH